MDEYTKPAWELPLSKIISPHVVSISFEQWVVADGIPAFVLTDNDLLFVKRFLESGIIFELKHLTTVAYQRRTRG